MILVDISGHIYKELFSSVKYSVDENGRKIKKVNGVYPVASFERLFKNKLIMSLIYIHTRYSGMYGDIILCKDTKVKTWRKKFYPDYKLNRKQKKSDIDFNEFFEMMNKFWEVLEDVLPFKIVEFDEAEGDDVIAVLAKNLNPNEKHLIISRDKDMVQLYKYKNITIATPFSNTFVERPKDIKKAMLSHIIDGDASDNIPKVFQSNEFTDEFISFCRNNDIYEDDVQKFLNLSISDMLIEDYLLESDAKGIYKTKRLSKKVKDELIDNLSETLKNNKFWADNFKRNATLISFDYIPKYIEDGILDAYAKATVNTDPKKFVDFLMEANLFDIMSKSHQLFKKSESRTDVLLKKNTIEAW